MAGSAAVAATYLLVEHAGPWGRKALAESRFAEDVRHGLAEASDAAGVRVQLIRRPGRSVTGDALRIFATYADPVAPWTATAVLSAPDELMDLDLAALAAGSPAGLAPHEAPLYLVCTNGRRDLCCAEKGRPIVTALAAAYPDETWETTHVGGHRFAGAMLVLPHGLSYGRLDADTALGVVERSRSGELDLAHLRGRSAYDGAVQAAEIAARERLGETRVDALDPRGCSSDAGAAVDVRFAARGRRGRRSGSRRWPPLRHRQSCADLSGPSRTARPTARRPPDGRPQERTVGGGWTRSVTGGYIWVVAGLRSGPWH